MKPTVPQTARVPIVFLVAGGLRLRNSETKIVAALGIGVVRTVFPGGPTCKLSLAVHSMSSATDPPNFCKQAFIPGYRAPHVTAQ